MIEPNEVEAVIPPEQQQAASEGLSDTLATGGEIAFDLGTEVGIEAAIETGASIAETAADGAAEVAGDLLGGIFDLF